MENNAKLGSGEAKTVVDDRDNNNSSSREHEPDQESNPNLGSSTDNGEQEEVHTPRQSSRRIPFTNLSQVDADLALARTLQEQERAYMMLRINTEGSDYGSWEAGSYLHDDEDDFGDPDDDTDGEEEVEDNGNDVDDGMDAFDVHADADDDVDNNPGVDLDLAIFSSDEAYARALQDAEEREMAARLLALAGINDGEVEDIEEHGVNSLDAWEEVDPDELSYEELIALGEVVGSESRGLSADIIASLPSVIYKAGNNQNGSNDSCVICRLDYEDGETLTVLSCKHSYHSDCINNWLKINKIQTEQPMFGENTNMAKITCILDASACFAYQVCPVCSTEVSSSGHS